jgi:regulator of protease activity HflC (stomatin/prohibitin superfamily)
MTIFTRDADNSTDGLTKSARNTALAVLGMVLFFTFSFRTIEAGQVGVVTRFGDVDREVQPGIASSTPFAYDNQAH